jgi:hypothetical protein
MARWDDLADDAQEVVSAFMRGNLEAELAEEAIRLQSLVKETASKLLKFRNGAFGPLLPGLGSFSEGRGFPTRNCLGLKRNSARVN